MNGARFLIGLKRSYSFPSAHAANSFAQATLFSLIYPRLAPVLLSIAFVVSLSRVYVGVHYPLDVLFGALLGTCVAICVWRFGRSLAHLTPKHVAGPHQAAEPLCHETVTPD